MKRTEPQVYFQPLDGGWQLLSGIGGVIVENVQYDAECDPVGWGGSATASFDLTTDRRMVLDQLKVEPPIAIKHNGTWVWRGQAIKTPTHRANDLKTTVQCIGVRETLKDYPIDKTFIVANLAGFQDARSAGSSLANFTGSPSVATDVGGVTLQLPTGLAISGAIGCGVTLDLGVNNTAARVIITWTSSNNDAGVTAYVRTSSSPDGTVAGSDSSFLMNSGASGTVSYSPTAGRYVHVLLFGNTSKTLTADVWLKITSVLVATSTTYAPATTSALTAADVIKYMLTAGAPVVSSDQSQIQTPSFNLPEYSTGGRLSVDEAGMAVNDYQRWQLLLTADPTPVPIYRPIPTVASYVIGSDDLWEWDNPTVNDTTQVFSDIIVPFTHGDGTPDEVVVSRTTNPILAASPAQYTNSSFDVDVSNWTAVNGTITRDTVTFDSTPASALLTSSASKPDVSASTSALTGSLIAGASYRLTFRYNPASLVSCKANLNVSTAIGNTNYTVTLSTTPGWQTATIDFVVPANMTNCTFTFSPTATAVSTAAARIDTLVIQRALSSLLERRGRRRAFTKRPRSKQSTVSATQLGQVVLDTHQTAPLGGSGKLNQTYIRQKGSDAHIPIERVVRDVGALVLFEHLIDPNTGALGRTATIVKAGLGGGDGQALSLSFDNEIGFEDVIDSRMALMLQRRGL